MSIELGWYLPRCRDGRSAGPRWVLKADEKRVYYSNTVDKRCVRIDSFKRRMRRTSAEFQAGGTK